MNGSGRVRRCRFFLWLAPVLLTSVAVPAGRSDAAEQTVAANTVIEGLKTIQHAGEEVAEYAGEDKAKTEQYLNRISPVWTMIEGTIRGNDQAAYTAFEGAIKSLDEAAKAGDGEKAGEAAQALAKASTAYVAKFPAGTAAKSAPARDAAPGPAEKRTAAAAPTPDAAPAAIEPGDPALARTGPMSDTLAALAGAALALGGLAIIGGAGRRVSAIA